MRRTDDLKAPEPVSAEAASATIEAATAKALMAAV
jgi:hypothetical protein